MLATPPSNSRFAFESLPSRGGSRIPSTAHSQRERAHHVRGMAAVGSRYGRLMVDEGVSPAASSEQWEYAPSSVSE